MGLFRKKKKEEDIEHASRGKDPASAKASVRRRKEPPKPWGKKERLLVLVVLFITMGTSAVLGVYSRGWKLPGLPRLKAPSIRIPFFGEETIVIEGNKKEAEKAKKAKSQFADLTDDKSGIYGLYVVRIGNGSRYGVNEDDVLQAASLIKLPVMAAMYKEVEEEGLSLETKYKLKGEDKVSGAGSLRNKPVGYEITYRELLRLVGKQSDNTAFNIVKNLLGDDKVSEVINSMGMVNTSLSENTTTPSDVGTFFEGLYNARLPAPERSNGGQGNIVSKESAEELLEFLTDTVFESWITGGVPEEVRVAHKFGRELHVVNDAGIVFTENPYVIVVMGDKIVEREADEVIPQISRMVYEVEMGIKR